jgi:hypothetical protein
VHIHGSSQLSRRATFLGIMMDDIAKEIRCAVMQRRFSSNAESYDYLNIDAMFVDRAEYDLLQNEATARDPFVLPRAVREPHAAA